MNTLIEPRILKNGEFMLRLIMAVTMFAAAISKLFSGSVFREYYLTLFSNPDLRINLPVGFVQTYLNVVPFVELIIAFGLLIPKLRRYFAVAFVFYILSLTAGHFILEEIDIMHSIIPLAIVGIIDYILPAWEDYTDINSRKA